jgi:hypothetical protein
VSSRLFLILSSRQNLVGTILALIGLALFFAGLIRHYWAFIVFGLYALGFLLTPRKQVALAVHERFDADRIEEALDDLTKSIRRKVPPEILEQVASIRASILAILPEFQKTEAIEHTYNLHVIQQTALEYLPDMLESYLNLPAAFARMYPVKDGKTARQILLEQLELLDGEMKKIIVDLHRKDMNALVAHGNFLKEKFGHGEWKLG